ncbi:pseudouridine synthase [Syncephalis fuscata]|nr:pseudouridine synthase [Syncephalis fuscata]
MADNSDVIDTSITDTIMIDTTTTTTAPETTKDKSSKRRQKEPRVFDMSKYAMRRIALKVSYFGWEYYGFAAQNVGGHGGLQTEAKSEENTVTSTSNEQKQQQQREEVLPTVEGRLIDALIACRLIIDPQSSRYTRCGRTDRGVSAAGQVIALDVRSALPQNSPGTLDEQRKTIASLSKTDEALRDANKELPFADLLNRQLPEDIRILAWAPVPDDFDARFNCQWRHYRYYFNGKNLNTHQMQEAANLFVGTQDFRNFCRIDPSKPSLSFEREVLSCRILVLDDTATTTTKSDPFYVLDMKGTAFLWHQVRCMMAVLLLVGQGLETVDTVRALLDPSKWPRGRPTYDMASELPLVLHHCEFDQHVLGEWRYAPGPLQLSGYTRLADQIDDQWRRLYTQWLVCDALRGQLKQSILLTTPPEQDEHNCSWQHLQSIRDSIDKIRALSLPSSEMPTIGANLLKALHRVDPHRPDVYQGGGDSIRGRRYVPLLNRPTCESYEEKRRKYLDRRSATATATTTTTK